MQSEAPMEPKDGTAHDHRESPQKKKLFPWNPIFEM
jgi:hypothetical protein